MIRINLLSQKEAQLAAGRRRQVSIALLSATLALLVMVVPYVLQGLEMSRLQTEIDDLSAEVAKLNQQAREVRDLERRRAELKAKLEVIDQLKAKRVGPARMLADLSGATPEKLWLIDFTDVGSVATVTGMALDNQTIATFMRQLQDSKYFYEVDLVETSQFEPQRGSVEAQLGMVFKRFIVKARLDYTGAEGKGPAQPAPNSRADGGAPPSSPGV
jgi:type IV pilus assembly protein PilN